MISHSLSEPKLKHHLLKIFSNSQRYINSRITKHVRGGTTIMHPHSGDRISEVDAALYSKFSSRYSACSQTIVGRVTGVLFFNTLVAQNFLRFG
jgi:hypothetical protein